MDWNQESERTIVYPHPVIGTEMIKNVQLSAFNLGNWIYVTWLLGPDQYFGFQWREFEKWHFIMCKNWTPFFE